MPMVNKPDEPSGMDRGIKTLSAGGEQTEIEELKGQNKLWKKENERLTGIVQDQGDALVAIKKAVEEQKGAIATIERTTADIETALRRVQGK